MTADLSYGSRVRFGFRTGTVIRLDRRHRQAGAVVQSDQQHPGDGNAPHWVPLTQLTAVDEDGTG